MLFLFTETKYWIPWCLLGTEKSCFVHAWHTLNIFPRLPVGIRIGRCRKQWNTQYWIIKYILWCKKALEKKIDFFRLPENAKLTPPSAIFFNIFWRGGPGGASICYKKYKKNVFFVTFWRGEHLLWGASILRFWVRCCLLLTLVAEYILKQD